MPTTIADVIKGARHANGVSLRELGKRAGVSDTLVSLAETGARNLGDETERQIIHALADSWSERSPAEREYDADPMWVVAVKLLGPKWAVAADDQGRIPCFLHWQRAALTVERIERIAKEYGVTRELRAEALPTWTLGISRGLHDMHAEALAEARDDEEGERMAKALAELAYIVEIGDGGEMRTVEEADEIARSLGDGILAGIANRVRDDLRLKGIEIPEEES